MKDQWLSHNRSGEHACSRPGACRQKFGGLTSLSCQHRKVAHADLLIRRPVYAVAENSAKFRLNRGFIDVCGERQLISVLADDSTSKRYSCPSFRPWRLEGSSAIAARPLRNFGWLDAVSRGAPALQIPEPRCRYLSRAAEPSTLRRTCPSSASGLVRMQSGAHAV